MATLSVRSGLDLMLQALALPRGSEVLMSAVTIADMAAVVAAHGLVRNISFLYNLYNYNKIVFVFPKNNSNNNNNNNDKNAF